MTAKIPSLCSLSANQHSSTGKDAYEKQPTLRWRLLQPQLHKPLSDWKSVASDIVVHTRGPIQMAFPEIAKDLLNAAQSRTSSAS